MSEIMPPNMAVYVCLLNANKQVYLQRRSETKNFGGCYEPVGGKVEDEPPLDAVCREANEEAGVALDPSNLELYHTYINLQERQPWLGLMFRTTVWLGAPTIQEPDNFDKAGLYHPNSLPSRVSRHVADGLGRLLTAPAIDLEDCNNYGELIRGNASALPLDATVVYQPEARVLARHR